MNTKLRNQSGITLIALIITIIILVILAAVSVKTIYDMGIVRRAVDGTQQYAERAVEENNIFNRVQNLLDDTILRINGIQDGCGITLNKDRLGLQLEGNRTVTEQLTATLVNIRGDVVWESSVPGVATVSNDGTITAVSLGTTIVTATVEFDDIAYTASCEVEITNIPVTSVNVTPTSANLNVGGTTTLSATVSPNNVTNSTVRWSSENEAVATVTSAGLVTAVGGGTTRITATANDGSGYSASCTVTVNVPVTGLALYKSGENANTALASISATLQEEDTITLVPVFTPNDASNQSISWTTNNSSVATVSNQGVIEAVAEGTATITASANGGTNVTATCVVTVERVAVSISIRIGNSVLQVTEDNVNDYMGKIVQNYKGTSGSEFVPVDPNPNTYAYTKDKIKVSKVYRLFYVDFNGDYGDPGTIYLKADSCGESYVVKGGWRGDREEYADLVEGDLAGQLNPGLNIDTSYDGIEGYTYVMETSSLWSSLVSSGLSTGIGQHVLWACGGPSLPMFIDSFNMYYGLTDANSYAPEMDEFGDMAYRSSLSPMTKLFYRPDESRSYYELGCFIPTLWGVELPDWMIQQDPENLMYCPPENQGYYLSTNGVPDAGSTTNMAVITLDYDGHKMATFTCDNIYTSSGMDWAGVCPLVAVDKSAILEFAN